MRLDKIITAFFIGLSVYSSTKIIKYNHDIFDNVSYYNNKDYSMTKGYNKDYNITKNVIYGLVSCSAAMTALFSYKRRDD